MRLEGLDLTWEVSVGPVAETVLDYWEADLIAISNQGQARAKRIGLGPTGDQLPSEAAVLIMIVGPSVE